MTKFFVLLILSVTLFAEAKAVVVIKSKRILYLVSNGEVQGQFHISLGANPNGHKRQEGDEKTPEGNYMLDFKNENSQYFKSIHISYPNIEDKTYAKNHQLNPGGMIMIHGQRNYFGWLSPLMQKYDWTDGCIALSNEDMEKVWEFVDIEMPIHIVW